MPCMYKIFLIEDDEAIAGALMARLTAWGWEARKARDFTRVLEELREFEPHLVLLDISLPSATGTTGVPRSGASARCR